jgi:scyllo-inositol 2-dehydrogenase (NADP+)
LSGRVFHAPVISCHAGFRLKKVVERSPRGSRDRYPYVEVVREYADLLRDEAIELVVVNTPEHTHYELTRQALLAGKHVVVEKAFTPTAAEAQDLIDLAKKEGLVLSVYQNSRWNGDFLTIQKVVENKLLGQLVEYEAHFDRFRNFIQADSWKEDPKPGIGVLYNLGSHIIDQALVLFGWPQSLWAHLRTVRPGGQVVDNFELVLFYENLKVTLKSSYLVREPGPRYTLHGTKGSFVKFGFDPQEEALNAGRLPSEPGWGQEPPERWGKLNTELNGLYFEGKIETIPGSYVGYYDSIYGAIREQKELAVKPEQALRTIAIIEAATQSHQEKRVVALEPLASDPWKK